jgi:hypothetical protein
MQPDRTALRKARALLFRILAILWVFPSIGAVWILGSNAKGWEKSGAIRLLRSLAVEDWVAIALLACHFIFILRAFRTHAVMLREQSAGSDSK